MVERGTPLLKKMEISVAEAEKRTGKNTVNMQETYTVYLIETRSDDCFLLPRGFFRGGWVWRTCCIPIPILRPPETVPEGGMPAAPDTLWRRYSEFELLRTYLLVTYPYIIVPPLPEKRVRGPFSSAECAWNDWSHSEHIVPLPGRVCVA